MARCAHGTALGEASAAALPLVPALGLAPCLTAAWRHWGWFSISARETQCGVFIANPSVTTKPSLAFLPNTRHPLPPPPQIWLLGILSEIVFHFPCLIMQNGERLISQWK